MTSSCNIHQSRDTVKLHDVFENSVGTDQPVYPNSVLRDVVIHIRDLNFSLHVISDHKN